MTNSDSATLMLDFRMVKAGAVLASAGLMLATAGTGLVGLALTRAAREWLRRSEVSPTAVATDRVRQARHATTTGARAWRDYQLAGANGASRH
jgi:hypothetical protein